MLSATLELSSVARANDTTVGELEFQQVYEAHFDFVWRSVRRLGVFDRDVDDVVQETFLVAYRRLETFEGRSTLRSWLFGIARRVVSDHRRRVKRHPEDALAVSTVPEAEGRDAHPDEQVARVEATRVLRAFLETLADEQREVFILAELEQMSAPEIAAATGAVLNTVYSRLRLARAAFEKMIARRREEEESPCTTN